LRITRNALAERLTNPIEGREDSCSLSFSLQEQEQSYEIVRTSELDEDEEHVMERRGNFSGNGTQFH